VLALEVLMRNLTAIPVGWWQHPEVDTFGNISGSQQFLYLRKLPN
jgi:hypothetical protein